MANPDVTTQIDHADPEANPLNINEHIDLLNTLIHSEIQGSYMPYIIQKDTPTATQRDYAWIEVTDDPPDGIPKALKIWYKGNWRRVYNGMLGEIRPFSGNPGLPNFDSNGKGAIGLDYDGWQICNGKNGSPNLTDKFIVAAHMDNTGGHSGYSGGKWKTFITEEELSEGGAAEITLNADNTYIKPRPELEVGKWAANGNARSTTGNLFGDIDTNEPIPVGHNEVIYQEDEGNEDPDPIKIIPPFYALAYIIFQGY